LNAEKIRRGREGIGRRDSIGETAQGRGVKQREKASKQA